MQKDNGKKERESLFRSGTNTYKITKKCQGTRQGRLQGTPGLLTSPDDHKSYALGWGWQGEHWREDERVWGALKSKATFTANALPNCHHGKRNKTIGLIEKQKDNHSPKKPKPPQNEN